MKFQTILRTLAGVIGIYLFTYAVLSTAGGYAGPVATVKVPLSPSGWRTFQIYIWEPKFLELKKDRWNLGGICFAPVIQLDRAVWHLDERHNSAQQVTLKPGKPVITVPVNEDQISQPQVDECTQDILNTVSGLV